MDKQHHIPPELSKISRGTPFKVPDGYFETFSDRLGKAIHEKHVSPVKKMHQLRPYLAAAILIVVALVAGNYVLRNNTGNSDDRFHAEVSRVIEQELYSISEEAILEAMETDISPETEAPETEDMINYLLDEQVDETDMINAL